MPYSQENYDEAYRLRKQGNDDVTIRMTLASKKMKSDEMDELFIVLDAALPPSKKKNISNKDPENVERRDFYILMIALVVGGAIAFGIGLVASVDILRVFGFVAAFFGLWGLSRSARDDRREARRRNRDE